MSWVDGEVNAFFNFMAILTRRIYKLCFKRVNHDGVISGKPAPFKQQNFNSEERCKGLAFIPLKRLPFNGQVLPAVHKSRD